jgi:hypothetical protein
VIVLKTGCCCVTTLIMIRPSFSYEKKDVKTIDQLAESLIMWTKARVVTSSTEYILVFIREFHLIREEIPEKTIKFRGRFDGPAHQSEDSSNSSSDIVFT